MFSAPKLLIFLPHGGLKAEEQAGNWVGSLQFSAQTQVSTTTVLIIQWDAVSLTCCRCFSDGPLGKTALVGKITIT